jgi:hypothetical protein
MDKDRIVGSAKEITGTVKEAADPDARRPGIPT